MNRDTINILRGLGARCLKAGLVALPEVHELSRAMLALDAMQKELEEAEKRRAEEEAKRPKPVEE